jgi:hypothetical protein
MWALRRSPLSLGVLALCVALGHARDSHQVRGRFETTALSREIRFVFEVHPAVRIQPIVRRLGAHPRQDTTTLEVLNIQPAGRYAVVLRELSPGDQGRLQIEVKDDSSFELHQADFVLRAPVPDQMVSASGFGGGFVVHAAKAPANTTLLIATTELPLDALPGGVAANDVVATYSLEFMPQADITTGWSVSIGALHDARSVYFRPKPDGRWQATKAMYLPDHAVLTTAITGPGTWLLVRAAPR